MPGSALPVLPAALRRTQAPIYAGERRPLARPLPPQPPPGCYFKHAGLGDHLSTAKFAEKIKACEPRGRFSPPRAALGRALGREPAVVAGTSRRSGAWLGGRSTARGLGMLSRGHLPCRGRCCPAWSIASTAGDLAVPAWGQCLAGLRSRTAGVPGAERKVCFLGGC